MKFFCFLATLLATALVAGTAGAQTAQSGPQPASLEVRRAGIGAERARLQALFSAEDAACHERFAVNSCLDKVSTKRREAMAELRRQEIALNDEARKNRAEAQLRKIEEKSSPEKQQEAAQRRAQAAEDYRLRLEREKNQQQGRAGRAATLKKLREPQRKSQADRQGAAAEEAKKFNQRQQQAQARRARHEANQLGRPPAKPLPLPPLPGSPP